MQNNTANFLIFAKRKGGVFMRDKKNLQLEFTQLVTQPVNHTGYI